MNMLNIQDEQIQLTLMLKLQKLQREQLPGLNYKNLEDVMLKLVWKRNTPKFLHEAVNDILSLTADQIVRFLSRQAVIEGYHQEISEFSDLIGGREL